MEVNINEVRSSVRAVDGDAALSPQTMQKIIEAVMREVEERDRHRDRVHSEQQVDGGARSE